MSLRRFAALWCFAMLAFQAPAAFGCPICFGESNDPIAQGAQVSVIFMAALVYSLILGGLVAFIVVRRRALRLSHESPDALSSPEVAGP